MRIVIGSDHGGFKLKGYLVKYLVKTGNKVKDCGVFSEESSDYPPIGYIVSKFVGSGKFPRGILICKTGIGMSIVANKVKGVRAALCGTVDIARSSREHNDSNVLVLAANMVSARKAKHILKAWLSAPSPVGRHKRRVNQIKKIEKLQIFGGRK